MASSWIRALFYTIAFSGRGRPHNCRRHDHAVCAEVGWEVVMTPATYKSWDFLKRVEHEDYYDRDTNFTPFSLRA